MSFSWIWRLDGQGQGACLVGAWWRASSGLQMADFSLCPHMVQGARALSWVSFVRSLVLFVGASATGPDHLPKALPPNTTALGVRFQQNRKAFGLWQLLRMFYQTKGVCISSHFIGLSQEWVLSFLEGVVILCGENHLIFSLALLVREWYQ